MMVQVNEVERQGKAITYGDANCRPKLVTVTDCKKGQVW